MQNKQNANKKKKIFVFLKKNAVKNELKRKIV